MAVTVEWIRYRPYCCRVGRIRVLIRAPRVGVRVPRVRVRVRDRMRSSPVLGFELGLKLTTRT